MKIKPLKNNIFLELIAVKSTTTSGIIVPEFENKKFKSRGKVIAVGKEVSVVEVGDIVLFKPNNPHEVELGEKKFLIAKEEDILGIIEL